MSAEKKNITRKVLKKRSTTVIVIESEISAKDTFCPEKVARANKILSNTTFNGSKLKGW
jgi:hypothetical protein